MMHTPLRPHRAAPPALRTLVLFAAISALFLPAGATEDDRRVNQGPTPFTCYPAKEIDSIPGHVMRIFSWSASSDPEGGVIEYRLLLYQNGEEIFRRDGITETFIAIDLTAEVPGFDPDLPLDFLVVALDPFWREEQPTFGLPPSAPTDKWTSSSVTIPAYLWGYVYDAETELPVTGALVFTPQASALCEDGSYALEVQAGECTLMVSATGYETYTETIRLGEGSVLLRNISLTPSFQDYRGTLYGAILDETTGKPVRSARLYYGEHEVQIDGGNYVFTLPEGRYVLTCRAEGYAERTVAVMLRRNQTVSSEFHLEATDEHVWAHRRTYNPDFPEVETDPRFLDVSFSGMSGLYDLYVAALLPDGTFYFLRSPEAVWGPGGEVAALARNIGIPDGTYSLMLLRSIVRDAPVGTSIFVVCARPGAVVTDPETWEASAILIWR